MKVKKEILWIITFLAVTLLGIFLYRYIHTPVKNKILIAGKEVYVDVADTDASRETGLMYKKFMPENQGMLFVFDKEDQYAFWMRNTFIPLDIIWVDKNYKVVDIKENFQPCTIQECIPYIPEVNALYVIEVNAGWAKNNNLKIGDSVKLK